MENSRLHGENMVEGKKRKSKLLLEPENIQKV